MQSDGACAGRASPRKETSAGRFQHGNLGHWDHRAEKGGRAQTRLPQKNWKTIKNVNDFQGDDYEQAQQSAMNACFQSLRTTYQSGGTIHNPSGFDQGVGRGTDRDNMRYTTSIPPPPPVPLDRGDDRR